MNDNEVEKQLRHALRRSDAPEGFVDRVLKRVAAEDRLKVLDGSLNQGMVFLQRPGGKDLLDRKDEAGVARLLIQRNGDLS